MPGGPHRDVPQTAEGGSPELVGTLSIHTCVCMKTRITPSSKKKKLSCDPAIPPLSLFPKETKADL